MPRATTPETTICTICHTHNQPVARFCQRCGNNIVLDGLYRVIRIIKEGGMGTVFEAVDAKGERYAIKELIDRGLNPEEKAEAVKRFLDEAQILSRLRHQRIPRVYRSFLHGNRYYLSMDFVNGEDLEELLRRSQRFDETTVLRWADQITDVLSYLHDQAVIYRDMKPSNVMIERDSGAAKLVDFGIAKLFQPAQRGTLIGTPGYAPPEQYQGLATPQSDVYALGATLHHLLTGRDPREEQPFSFPPVRSLAPDVSTETAAAIERALQMESAERWQSVREFRFALPIDARVAIPQTAQPTTMLPRGTQPPMPAPAPSAAARPAAQPQPQLRPLPAQPAPAPPRPAPAQPKPAQKPKPAPPPAQQAKPKKKRGPLGCLMSCVSTIFFLLIATGVITFFAAPTVFQEARDVITGFFPTQGPPVPATPTTGTQRFTPQNVTYALTVQAPSGVTNSELDKLFRSAFLVRAQEQFGPATRLGNVPPQYIAEPVVGATPIGPDDGTVPYDAEMAGTVFVPQP